MTQRLGLRLLNGRISWKGNWSCDPLSWPSQEKTTARAHADACLGASAHTPTGCGGHGPGRMLGPFHCRATAPPRPPCDCSGHLSLPLCSHPTPARSLRTDARALSQSPLPVPARKPWFSSERSTCTTESRDEGGGQRRPF